MLAGGERVRAARRREPRPVLGDPRRRRQLRRRHLVPVPAPRRRHRRRRPDLLGRGAERRGAERLSRFHPRRAARAQRLVRLRQRAAGAALPRGAAHCARSAASSGATSAARRRRTRRWRRCSTAPEPLMDGVPPMPFPALQSAFDGLYPKGEQWYWRADFVKRDPRRGGRRPRPVRAEDADDAVDDAHVSDRRRRPRHRRDDTALAYRDANWGSVFAGVDADPANADEIALEHRLPGGAAPVLGRRRLREHDDGRGAGAGAGKLRRQLRAAGADQGRTTTPTTSSASTRTSSRAAERT